MRGTSLQLRYLYPFIIDILEKKEDISNATALHSSLMTGSRMIGPAIAGIIIATWGAGYCFLIDGISYIAIISALLAIKVPLKIVGATNTLKIGGAFCILGAVIFYKNLPTMRKFICPIYIENGLLKK